MKERQNQTRSKEESDTYTAMSSLSSQLQTLLPQLIKTVEQAEGVLVKMDIHLSQLQFSNSPISPAQRAPICYDGENHSPTSLTSSTHIFAKGSIRDKPFSAGTKHATGLDKHQLSPARYPHAKLKAIHLSEPSSDAFDPNRFNTTHKRVKVDKDEKSNHQVSHPISNHSFDAPELEQVSHIVALLASPSREMGRQNPSTNTSYFKRK